MIYPFVLGELVFKLITKALREYSDDYDFLYKLMNAIETNNINNQHFLESVQHEMYSKAEVDA
jgi:hypothetical protein